MRSSTHADQWASSDAWVPRAQDEKDQASARMKAAVYHRYGLPEVIEVKDVDNPVPKDSQVIRIHATTVSAADWRMRRAAPFIVRFMTGLWGAKKIQILGMEFSGRVESVGRAVTRFGEGDQVFGSTGFKFSAHPEYNYLPEDALLATKPVNMSFEEAAAVLFGGVSAAAVHALCGADGVFLGTTGEQSSVRLSCIRFR